MSHFGTGSNAGGVAQGFASLIKVATTEDRKSKSRIAFCRPAAITLSIGDTKHSAFTRDVSDTGLGLLHQMPIPPQVVELEVRRANGSMLIFLLDVKWSSNYGHGFHISGGTFVIDAGAETKNSNRRMVSANKPYVGLQLLADARRWGVEKRACGRTPFFLPATVQPINGGSSCSAFTREISELGISLVHWTPMQLGDAIVAIDLGDDIIETPLTMTWSHCIGKDLFISGGHI